ncbi:MAG: MgtC/SapB family protein [Candidatus Aminicenantes bacterium]|jgi:putative Mg2+ transporter-C (MgtC) family protein
MEIEIILKMLLAAVLGGIIGLEREISHKEAGVKVNVLIAMASALLTVLSIKLAGIPGSTSTSSAVPVAGHMITALGLIGAAIIIKERFTPRGLTTTAVVWSVGAIGMVVGSGYYLTAFLVTIFTVVGLTLVQRLSSVLEKQGKRYIYVISTEERAAVIIEVKKIITDLGIHYSDAHLIKTREGYEIEIAVTTSQQKNKSFIERVMQIPDVKKITSEHI